MFDMKHNASDNEGYELHITYNARCEEYAVTGYLLFAGRGGNIEKDRDGATKYFPTMQEAIDFITKETTK